jgi:hypothetical protein
METDVSSPRPASGQDAEYYAALLEPAHGMGEQDEFYVATRRLLLARKAAESRLKRQVRPFLVLVRYIKAWFHVSRGGGEVCFEEPLF